jgi:HSP20 family protein
MVRNTLVSKQEQGKELAKPERTRGAVTYTPRCDIFESEEELILRADLPGVASGDPDVRFENGELMIYARCQPRQNDASYLAHEYGVGDYYRAFTVGEAIDAGNISAEMKQGVLTVHLPKSEAAKPKRISVRAQ